MLEHPLLETYARWREAEAALHAGQPRNEVSPSLRVASAVATRLGARPLQREVEALARAARIDLADRLHAPEAEPRSSAVDVGLTPREIDVLELIAEGCTNNEISRRLFISPKTTSVHVSHILAKLDVENRLRAVATARRLGLFDTQQTAP